MKVKEIIKKINELEDKMNSSYDYAYDIAKEEKERLENLEVEED